MTLGKVAEELAVQRNLAGGQNTQVAVWPLVKGRPLKMQMLRPEDL